MQDLLEDNFKESKEAEMLQKLLAEYYDYVNVFSKAVANELLLH